MAGQGVRAVVDGREVLVGNERLMTPSESCDARAPGSEADRLAGRRARRRCRWRSTAGRPA